MRGNSALLGASALLLVVSVTVPRVARAQGAPVAPPKQSMVIKGRAPVSNEVLQVKLPRPKEGTLSNGLHLIVLEDHRTPQVAFQLIIPGAGGYFDPSDKIGVASVTASMMREGTPTRTTTQIAEQIETMAASLFVNAGMSGLDGSLVGGALTDKFPAMFDLAADVLLHPAFPESELAKYKQRTAAQLAQQRSIAGFLGQEIFSKVMLGSHPGARISMTPDDVKRLTRDDLVAFYSARYAPDHSAIAFAGDISYDQAKAIVESKLGAWKRNGMPVVVARDPAPSGAAKVYLVDRPTSVQTSLLVGAPGIARTDKDYDVLQVMNAVVGGGPTGRLFTHLREEKGYTYGAYSGLNAGRYRGTWMASTDVRSEVTDPALTDLMDELRQIRDIPVSATELRDKQRSLVAGFALSLESPQQVLGYYVQSWLYNLPTSYWEQYPKRVMAVTPAQVQAAAKKYLAPGRVQIFAVGDGKKIEETLRKFGQVEVYDTEGKKREMVP